VASEQEESEGRILPNEHIFSDKTGTLTEKRMKLLQLSARHVVHDLASDWPVVVRHGRAGGSEVRVTLTDIDPGIC
jgi:magnesium-transporting ATPase (P-type)